MAVEATHEVDCAASVKAEEAAKSFHSHSTVAPHLLAHDGHWKSSDNGSVLTDWKSAEWRVPYERNTCQTPVRERVRTCAGEMRDVGDVGDGRCKIVDC